ncbi:MAG: YhcG family protein [Bacteroidales bacterium]
MKNEKPDTYSSILSELKETIRSARQKASVSVNTHLLLLYWIIGNKILEQQNKEGWGTKVIDRLAQDLKSEFPDMQGLSVRNIKYMRAFALAWPGFAMVQQASVQMSDITYVQASLAQITDIAIVQAPLAQISWYHHIALLDKLKDAATRQFYIEKTIQNGWSRNVLAMQIESRLHLRQGNAITNFEQTLPKPQSDLARETLKNPYLLDFLDVQEDIQERDLERGLLNHLKKFLLELGRGFAYVGNQFKLKVEDDDFFLDLLFYNYHLHCFVIFELKIDAFKPEYAGKLNFYINTINAQVKSESDHPTVGVLLCKTPNETVVKYSLQNILAPLGVAEYKLSNTLPKEFKKELPSHKELEELLNEDLIKTKGKK